MTTSQSRPAAVDSALLVDVRAVAHMLGCSWRHIYRLADAGKMPRPIRLGSLVRWRKSDLDQWLADGCQPIRRGSPK